MGKRSVEVHNGMDIVDSRDIIARLEELESDQETAMESAREVRERVGEIDERLKEIEEAIDRIQKWKAKGEYEPSPGERDEESLEEEKQELQEEKETLLARLWQDEKLEQDGNSLEYDSDISYWDEDTAEEFRVLTEFADEASGYAEDWLHGAGLIRESYFETYARDFAEDIGAVKRDMKWPCNHIDWEAAAEELAQDYTTVTWDGVDYLVR